MKSLCQWAVFVVLQAICSPVGFGQTTTPNISLDVRTTTAGGSVNSTNGASVGRTIDYDSNTVSEGGSFGSTRARSSSVSLDISLHNFRPNEQDVVVRTLFFTKGTSEKLAALQSSVVTPLKLPATGGAKTSATSKPAQSVTTRSFSESTTTNPYKPKTYTASSSTTTAGEKMFGWVVALEVDGRIIRTRTANPTLEAMLRDPAWIYVTAGLPIPQTQRTPVAP